MARRECSGHLVIPMLRVTLLPLWLHCWERVSIQPGMGSLIDDTLVAIWRRRQRPRKPPKLWRQFVRHHCFRVVTRTGSDDWEAGFWEKVGERKRLKLGGLVGVKHERWASDLNTAISSITKPRFLGIQGFRTWVGYCRRVQATQRGRRPPLFPETVATQPPSSQSTDLTLSVLVITQSTHKRAVACGSGCVEA